MAVRRAKYTEIPRIYELLEEAYEKSRYKDSPVTLDKKRSKAMLMQSMQRHGGTVEGSTLVLVSSDDKDMTQGFIIAVLCRVYEIGSMLYATDLFFYQGKASLAADARKLLQGVVDWATGNPKVYEVRFGLTDAVDGNFLRTAQLYDRMGFRQEGMIFGKRIER